MTSKKPLQVGILLTDPVQLLDMACVDMLAMGTPEYLSSTGMPKNVISLGKPCDFYWIGLPKGEKLQDTTAVVKVQTTHTIEDEAVAPGSLDILVIPGPDPKNEPSGEVRKFVREHNEVKTTMFIICTGAFVAAYSGIYEKKHVSGPRALIPDLKKKFPGVVWDDSLRVVRDGHLWTSGMFSSLASWIANYSRLLSGGITNGNDLVAAYIRETYPGPVAEIVCAMADVGDRSLKYDTAPTRDLLFFLWQFLKASPMSWFRRK
jgi:transcriptional regulator GlxA family with amidase domain